MKRINHKQGTQEWLLWRRKFITSSDASALLGKSPFMTPLQCYNDKQGLLKNRPFHPGMIDGIEEEVIARQWFIKETGIHVEPACIESELFPFLATSLDGISNDGSVIIEIKLNSEEVHANIENQIPAFHEIQIFHHYLACDKVPKQIYYVSSDKKTYKYIPIYIPKDDVSQYLDEAKKFFDRVVNFDPPDPLPLDYLDQSDNQEWTDISTIYKKICSDLKLLEESKNIYKKKLIELSNDRSCFGNGIKLTKKTIQGRIDYEKLILNHELPEEDIEKFRKPATNSWAITIKE